MSGLYLHIPFCRRKCPYCDFFSITATDSLVEAYPKLLIQHLAWATEHGWSGPVDSVYFGGGTPSLLKPEAIACMLQAINQRLGLAEDTEITLEANPGTVSQHSLAGYRSVGVNRLSLGLQSCNDDHLTLLGRVHNRQQGIDAFNWAREAGFDNISLDLMFALPGQTTAELEEDLRTYLELGPEHLSCYGLTAEPATPLQQRIITGELTLPDEEFYADAFMLVHEQLTATGYEHYEIANYARNGYASRHNLGYWKRHPYLGIGAGAHSFQDIQWGRRWDVPPDLSTYRQALHDWQEPMRCLETFDRQGALSETIYLALRTAEGVSDINLQRQFKTTLQEAFPEAVEKASPWLCRKGDCTAMTPAGWLLFDHLIQAFL